MVDDVWSVRRGRAIHLLGQTPHAEEILTFYVGLTEAQETVAAAIPVADWLGVVRSEEGDYPWLDVRRLPLDELALPFRDFLARVTEIGTETIKNGARSLIDGEDEHRLDTLRAVIQDWRKADDSEGTPDDALGNPEVIYGRAFLEPVVTAIVGSSAHRPADWTRNHCFACGGAPQVASLRDLPDAVGHRSLTCSMCSTEWRFQRLTCPGCGEIEAGRLPVHTAESIDHVRVDACRTCSRYIKTVDLRKEGNAVPLVDELASVALDIWAHEQGWKKLRVNVLGL